MDHFDIIDDGPSLNHMPKIIYGSDDHISEGLWLTLAKIIWGKDYIPLDSHDRASLNMILTIMTLVMCTIGVGLYIIYNRRNPLWKQNIRVSRLLRNEKVKRNGLYKNGKKAE